MPLIKSISGIRGTIGGVSGENLTPLDLVGFLSAFAWQIKQEFPDIKNPSVVLGRDGRVSGPLIHSLSASVLQLSGLNVLDVGLATTPTVEMSVIQNKAQGGLILSASHNPQQWNALKLLNSRGEFISADQGQQLLKSVDNLDFIYADVDSLGDKTEITNALAQHIAAILKLKLVNRPAITRSNFKVVVDGINSVGALAIPELLRALGVIDIELINGDINGRFAHNPEPLDENLQFIKERVVASGADLGIVVDPDVDRLAFITEKGEVFGEEYTLVAVAEYVLQNYCPCFYQKISVSNLSSSRALRDRTERHGGTCYAAAVGEVNVVEKMKETGAVIGGEGNGGIIYPELHYGRDALVGTALFLSALAESGLKVSEFKQGFPEYHMVKDKITLSPDIKVSAILQKIKEIYADEKMTDIDGVKIDWPESWVHLRASNTEPIIRVYAEARTKETAILNIKKIKEIIY